MPTLDKNAATPTDEEGESLLIEARKAFERCEEHEEDNREEGKKSVEFALLEKQWPDDVARSRVQAGRPMLTLSRMKSFLRQVVNDSRQNKPAIKVHPVDDNGDIETANVLAGIIRNIEATSNADIAYDTAIECAASYWVGYIRVDLDYTDDDSFDVDIKINRIANAASVYGCPDATSADGSDWGQCFVTERISRDAFEARWGDKSKVSWDDGAWSSLQAWKGSDDIVIAEWWKREPVNRTIVQLSTGATFDLEHLQTDEDLAPVMALIAAGVVQVVRQRTVVSHKVVQRIMTGAEVLETTEWPGRWIPIIPVYGDEFNIEGKRYVRSLIYSAMDAQRMFNYWRTTATELVALAPRVPYIGPQGAFKSDLNRWETANTESHAFLEYDGPVPPQRQPLDSGVAAGALQEALNAADDMKAIIGIYDASLGARSNETSGRAIMARQREGDVATFHFIDNLARSIRQVGRVVLDLIPHVYNGRRVAKVLGLDGTREDIPLGQPRQIEKPDGSVIEAIHDLTRGKYDVTVSTGPSFTTKRMEDSYNMIEFARAMGPQAAMIMLDKIAKSMDWPDAEEIAARAKAMIPDPNAQQQLPPEILQALEQGQQAMAELQQIKTDRSIEAAKVGVSQFQAETARIKEGNTAALQMRKLEADIQNTDANTQKTMVETNRLRREPIGGGNANAG